MSKKLLTFLTLLTLFFGVGWAATATVTLTQSNLELTGSYTTNTQKTIDGITYVYTDLMKNNENIQAKASSGEIHNSTAFSGDITSVVITHSGTARATTISGSSDGTNWTQVATGSGSITGDFSGKNYKYFKITRGSNAAYWTKIEITYEASGGGGDDPTPTTGTIYERVTSISATDVGKKFLLVYENTPAVNGAISDASTPYAYSITNGITLNGTTLTVESDEAKPFILGGQSGAWTFDIGGGNYLAWSSGNSLKTVTTLSNSSKWTISFSNGKPTIKNLDTSEREIRYNASSPRFACYTSGQADVYLYREVEAASDKAYDVTVTQAEGGTITALPFGEKVVDAGDKVTVTATPDAGYELTGWTITGASESAPDANNQITATDNVTITASFSKVELAINRVITTNGENNTAGGWLGAWEGCSTVGEATDATGYTVKAKVGSTITFKAGTNNTYQILTSNVTAVDGENSPVTLNVVSSDGTGTVFSFTMPGTPVTITANFTNYRGTIRLAGRFNGNTGWRTGTSGPAFTYDSTDDKYTIDAYFTGEGEGNYFFITYDGNASYPSANGNWGVTNTTGTPVGLTWDGNGHNFAIENGVFTIELAGDLSTIAFTKKEPTLTFSPVAGEIEQGATVSATSNLTTMIAAIKAIDSNAGGEVTVGVNTDNGNTWNASETLNTVGSATIYGKAYIGNIAVTGNASYTVVKANNSNKFELVTDLSTDLIAGKKYIIVNENNNAAYTGNGDNATAITITNHTTTIDPADVAVLTLGGSNNSWTFFFTRDGSTYNVYHTSPNAVKDNSFGASSTESASEFSISLNSGTFDISADSKHLRANAGTDFRFYDANSSGTAIQLYKQMVEEEKDYTITYAEVTGGSATGADGANEGETVTVTVTPDDGYAATGITVNPSVEVTDNQDGTYTFTMPASNVTVTPSFAQAYDITYVAEPAAGGIVTGVPSAVYDARVEVTVTPNADYQLSGTPTYTYNGITQQLAGAGTAESPYYFNMPGYATTVTANFVKIPHSITVVSTHGDVTGIPETATSGTQVTFTVTPNAGYVVSSVSGTFNNGNSSLNITDNGNGTYTFSMPASDVAITVTYFASEEYELLTDLADINAEDTYLIVGGPASDLTSITHVMGNTYANTRLNAIELTENIYDNETGVITSTANMSIVNFVPGSGENEGKWAIHNAAGYLYSNSSGSLSIGSTPYYAEISLDENSSRAYMTIGSVSLTFNSNSPMFRFYSQQQGAAYIFKLANKNKVKRPTITGAAGEFLGQYNFIGKDNVSMACATEDAVIEYSLDGGSTWLTYSEVFEITTNAAGNTVEVQARATKTGMEPSDVVTATFTCIKPTAPTFGTNGAGAYVNPVFVYPKSALNDRRAYGEESVSFCYTTNGTDADASSPAVATSNSNGYYIVLDDNATLSVVTVINGIASDPAGGEYTFSVDAPAFSLAGGSYDGNQQTRLSTGTKTQQNNLSWNTVIYYTTGNTEFAFNATTGEVTSEGWIAYDPTNSPYIDILAANGTTTIKAVTLSNYFNGQSEYRASDVTTETYVLTAANLSITISPAAGTYVNAQNVTLGVKNNIGDYIIYYTTDGSDPNTNGTEYTGTPITVDHDMTIKVYAVDSRTGDGGTATAEATYKIGIQPVVYSPFPGTVYKGDNEDINVEMFSVTPNAKIYYTVAEGEGNYPDDPTTSSTLYSESIPLETGKVYNFKAIAVVGSLVSTVTPGTFTVQAKGSGWLNVKEMNEDNNYSTADQLDNPVQVVYMSTWRNNGTKPEFCFVRDNSGYGLVYFGGSGVSSYNDSTKFKMGDWLAGGTVKGKLNVWNSSFINELGTSGGSITGWPSTSLGNTAILPEETTNKAITDGWTYEGAYTEDDYAQYIDPDKNLFGHYVHMRKNTITNVTGAGGGTEKHIGIITDQSGVPLNYYDGFYLFSGYNGTEDYDQTFFNNIQNNGGTFDVYAIVYFYGPNANNSSYSNAPYEIFPIDFEWIFKPLFNIETGTYYEPQTISLTCETEGAQIWYKTSEMEAYELYTGPFEVDATTTIETYSTLPSKYNDVLESVINSITVTIGTVDAPVITEESVVKTVGESVTTDITCTTEGATIYYTTDGSDPKTSETRIEYTLGQQLTFDETTTVRAIAMQDGYYSVEAESRTYTFVKSNGIEYTLVTNVSQLNENSVYVIVSKANNMAMSTNQKTNNRDAAGVMFKNADKTIVYGNDDLAQFTLKKSGNNWYIQTNNSNENGYLSVGNGNTLLTSATANGNAEATINIDGTNADVDKANEAHISFIYNNETTRYMRYWNRDHLFNTYTTETNAPVFLYYIQATPLATIEKEGVVGNQYTVADQLIAVHYKDALNDAGEHYLWCKDQGNVSISKTEKTGDDQIDYLKDVTKVQNGDWDQSNWVMLKFTNPTNVETISGAVGKYINPASITGHYTDGVNFTITLPDGADLAGKVGDKADFTPNVYCPVNFLDKNLNIGGGQGPVGVETGEHYFFMNPKIQEVATVTYAVWNGTCFVIPAKAGGNNQGDFDGAFSVAWTYNAYGDQKNNLQAKTAYRFTAVLNTVDAKLNSYANTGTKAGENAAGTVEGKEVEPQAGKVVYALDLNGGTGSDNIITAIQDVADGTGKAVAGVKYYNLAGIESDRPFEGVNIVVTTYTDGSRSSSKVLK